MAKQTPEQHRINSQIGAAVMHSRVSDERAATAPARAAFMSRFEREVDPDGVLPQAERLRRAAHARRAYFLRLAAASAKVRQANAERRALELGQEQETA